MEMFQIFKGSDLQFYFRLKAPNYEIVLKSTEGYTTKANCENGIASVKLNSQIDSRYLKFVGRDNQYYFRLIAGNGEPIGVSEGYTTVHARDNGIATVRKYAPTAPIEG